MLGAANGPDLQVLRAVFAGREAGPPAGWDGVQAFEQAAGVVLPEPYRSFAALIGDGCRAGPPSYGLVPLHQAWTATRTASPSWHGSPARSPSPAPGSGKTTNHHLLRGSPGTMSGTGRCS